METKARRSIFWALLLISIGVVFLLNTLGYIPGNGWELFLKLWPLIFIIGGLDNIFQGRGYIWAVVSLGLGTMFLLANFGYIAWSSLSLLLRLWPLLLIAAGLDLIFKGRSVLSTLIGVLLAVAVVGVIIWAVLTGVTAAQPLASQISQPLEGARQLNVNISHPAGFVEIGASENAEIAFEGKVTLAPRQMFDKDYKVKGNIGYFRMTSAGTVFFPWIGGLNQPLWDVDLNNTVPIDLTIDTAAGEQHIDLRGLEIENLDLSVAVGQLAVTLPKDGEFSGNLSNPIGSIKISVPSGALVEFRINGAFLSRSIPAGFTISGDRIYSPGANSGNADMRITIDQPIGRLELIAAP